jgi:hypothetical protein
MATVKDDDNFARLVTDPTTKWCRARLLHAMANAARQGVLDEVVGELVALDSESEEVLERLLEGLVDTGWLESPDDRLVP